MKKIEAIIQPFMMTPVLDALHAIDGLSGVTTSEVHGLNMRALATYERHVRLKLEIVVADDLATRVAEAIRVCAHTGNPGDGHVFILDVTQALSIRSGKSGTTSA